MTRLGRFAVLCISAAVQPGLQSQEPSAAEQILPIGQAGMITDAIYSHDGTLVLTTSPGSSNAVLWQAKSGIRLREFHCGSGSAIHLPAAIDDENRTALLGCPDHTVQLTDLRNGSVLKRVGPYRSSILGVAFSGVPGQIIVLAGGPMLIDLDSNRIVKQLPSSPINALVARSGACAVIWNQQTGDGRTVSVASLRSWQYSNDLEGVTYFNAGDISDDCTTAVLSADRNLTYIVDLTTGKIRSAWKAHPSGDLVAKLSPSGKFAVTGGVGDANARVWDVSSGKRLNAFPVLANQENPSVEAVGMSPDDRFVLAAPALNFGATIFDRSGNAPPLPLDSRSAADMTFAISPGGGLLATTGVASALGSVWLWDLRLGRAPIILRTGKSHPASLAFSQDGRFFAAGHRDGSIWIWQTADWSVVSQWKAHENLLSAIVFLANSHILTSSYDGTIREWDVATGQPLRVLKQAVTGQLEGPLGGPWVDSIFGMAITPDGMWVLAAGNGSEAALIEVKTGRLYKSFAHPQAWALDAIAISPDGTCAATAGNDGTVSLWDIQHRTFRKNLAGPFPKTSRAVSSMVFSPDGSRILASSGVGAHVLEEWDVATGTLIRRFPAISSEAIEMAGYTPDGRETISATAFGGIRLFGTDTTKLRITLLSFSDDTWCTVGPDGLFDTSRLEAPSPVRWIVPDDPFHPLGIEVFTRDYFSPKLLLRTMKVKSDRGLPAAAPLSQLNRVQPQVQIVEVLPQTPSTVTVRIGVRSETFSPAGSGDPLESGVFDLRLFRDGQLVHEYPGAVSDRSGQAAVSGLEAWRAQYRLLDSGESTVSIPDVPIPRRQGVEKVVFTAYAFNRDRVKSETSAPFVFRVHSTPGIRRKAYLITMAVNASQAGSLWDLDLALPSATLIRELWTSKLGKDYEVVPLTLESRLNHVGAILPEATAAKANLRNVLDILAGRESKLDPAVRALIDPTGGLGKATPDDAVVLYIVSHGYADPRGVFYLFPFDTGSYPWIHETDMTKCGENSAAAGCGAVRDFLAHAISSDELSSWWRGVDAGEMVLILDSCHSAAVSGEDFRPGPLGDPGFGQLSYDKGMRILAATQPNRTASATYLGRLGHSLLSEALRMMLQSQGQSLQEWLRAADQELPQRARHLYADLKEQDLQFPELMNFGERSTTIITGGLR